MKELFFNWEQTLSTVFIYPSLFQNFKILGLFSQKIPFFHKIPSTLRIGTFLELPLIFPHQIHSNHVLEINSHFLKNRKGDALITEKKALLLGVKTADCIPILISTQNKELIGAVHAGWRGSIKGILYNVLRIFLNKGFKPKEILIAMGPHIKTCCYEVREDLVEELKLHFENYKDFLIFREKKVFLNLEKINLFQAYELGIPFKNLWLSSDCTFCLNHLYWSHRFHKKNKRYQISLIGKL